MVAWRRVIGGGESSQILEKEREGEERERER